MEIECNRNEEVNHQIEDPIGSNNIGEIFQPRLNVDYSEFDPQKSAQSPRNIFRFDNEKLQESKSNADKIRDMDSALDKYIDIVNDLYFTPAEESQEQKEMQFKFSSLDLLISPLRSQIPLEKWSPYEIALFNCCICKFGKNFEIFEKIIKTKRIDEILEFYSCWKNTKYYSAWKANCSKKIKYGKQ